MLGLYTVGPFRVASDDRQCDRTEKSQQLSTGSFRPITHADKEIATHAERLVLRTSSEHSTFMCCTCIPLESTAIPSTTTSTPQGYMVMESQTLIGFKSHDQDKKNRETQSLEYEVVGGDSGLTASGVCLVWMDSHSTGRIAQQYDGLRLPQLQAAAAGVSLAPLIHTHTHPAHSPAGMF
eukprot:4703780-Amphidinium_carterae.1